MLHLIATHHGYCRPFAPPVTDRESLPVSMTSIAAGERLTTSSRTALERVDSGVSDRFWDLGRRFGWWGLAYLETLLRVADHQASRVEQEDGWTVDTPEQAV